MNPVKVVETVCGLFIFVKVSSVLWGAVFGILFGESIPLFYKSFLYIGFTAIGLIGIAGVAKKIINS